MNILKINKYVNIILFGFKTIFIKFLVMGNWFSFYLLIFETLIKKDTSLCKFYDNNNVDRDVQ